MLPPSPGWTQSGRYQQSSTVRASSACRQPPLPPHRLQPMVLNDGPTPAAVRLCCRAAAGSNRGTRSSDWQRGVPTASYSECGRTGSSGVHGRSLFFFFFSFLSLFPSPPSSGAARLGAAAAGGPRRTRRPAAVMATELQAGQTSRGEMSPSAPRRTTQQRAGPSPDI